MQSRVTISSLVLVVLIVGVFAFVFLTDLDLPAWLFAILAAIVLLGALATFILDYRGHGRPPANAAEARGPSDPAFVHFVFNDIRTAPVWLVLRLYLGLQWLDSGWGKVTDDAWMDGGTALEAYWQRAVAVPDPPARPLIAYDWYRDFLQFMLDRGWYTWFAPLIAVGEVLVGIALIIGALTAVAAAFGLVMNTAFMLAGSASTNPVLGALSLLIILGWKVAGAWGADRYLLPALGAPWSPGWLVRERERHEDVEERGPRGRTPA